MVAHAGNFHGTDKGADKHQLIKACTPEGLQARLRISFGDVVVSVAAKCVYVVPKWKVKVLVHASAKGDDFSSLKALKAVGKLKHGSLGVILLVSEQCGQAECDPLKSLQGNWAKYIT